MAFVSGRRATVELSGSSRSEWSCYEDNGGTSLGLSGEDFAILAGDTRVSTGYGIHTRYGNKLAKLTSNAVISSSGMLADRLTLHKLLSARMIQYKHQHHKEISIESLAQMLSNTLYYRRFFPYYTFNVLGGLDEEGKGAIYSYDAVGSFQRVPVSCSGSGFELIQPILDNQIERHHQSGKSRWAIPEPEAISIVKDAFMSATERDIYTGDFLDIAIINKNGIRFEKFELKHD